MDFKICLTKQYISIILNDGHVCVWACAWVQEPAEDRGVGSLWSSRLWAAWCRFWVWVKRTKLQCPGRTTRECYCLAIFQPPSPHFYLFEKHILKRTKPGWQVPWFKREVLFCLIFKESLLGLVHTEWFWNGSNRLMNRGGLLPCITPFFCCYNSVPAIGWFMMNRSSFGSQF